MFTLSKAQPEIIFEPDAHKILGSLLNNFGGRVIIICSKNPVDKRSISEIKDQLVQNSITFIQEDQTEGYINIEKLNTIKERARIFNVTSVVSVGGICQRMTSRYLSAELQLNYIEIPTFPALSCLLTPQSIYSNRIGNDYLIQAISPVNMKYILIDRNLHRNYNSVEILLESFTILLNLSQLFLNESNNIISIKESKNLFFRILDDLENNSIDQEKLLIYALTAELYHGASSNIDLKLTYYSWVSAYRYNFSSTIVSSKLLPTLLEETGESTLAIRIRELLHKKDISSRLADLGFTINQLTDVCQNRNEIVHLVKKSF